MAIELVELNENNKDLFISLNQEAFQFGYERYFGKTNDIIIPRNDIITSIETKGAHSYLAYLNGKVAGGVVVVIDDMTQINHLDILFVVAGTECHGVGFEIWNKIEQMFSKTKKWLTCTPYFDQRNIHFYVNKCKFHIIEFNCRYHNNPSDEEGFIGDAGEGMFEFEKIM